MGGRFSFRAGKKPSHTTHMGKAGPLFALASHHLRCSFLLMSIVSFCSDRNVRRTVRNDCMGPHFDISCLPDISKTEMNFLDTSFFQFDDCSSRELPTPASILQHYPSHGAGVIKLEELGLAVKFGHTSYVRLEEVQTMRAIKHAFSQDEVPVPEVFGWRKYNGQNFIYMSLVEGQTMREAWHSFQEADKESLCVQLSNIASALRQIARDTPTNLIGKCKSFHSLFDPSLTPH